MSSIFSSKSNIHKKIIKNLSGSKYKDYLATVSQELGVATGRIERYRDGVMVETANIPKF